MQYRYNFKLDKWKFHKGEIHSAESGGTIDETGWQDITVPHTWNSQDVLTDGPNYYQGIGWYRTNFMLNRDNKSSRYFIRFEGVSLVCDVFFNGIYLGTHKGGYSAFIYEITPYIKNGEKNYLSVKVNNATQLDVAPSGTYLYPIFGGIYRPVTIFSTPDLCISPLDHASSGTYISSDTISNESASINIQTLVNYRSLPIVQTKSTELVPPIGKKGIGLYGEYYSNPEFEGKPLHSRVDEEILFNYGNGAPFDDMPADRFSIAWTGRFIPKNSGAYRFILKSDDGSRLYLDRKMVIDNWGAHAALEKTFDTTLEAGREIRVKIEYNQLGGGASVMFGWSYQKQDSVPVEAFLSAEITDSTGKAVTAAKKEISIENNSEIKENQNLHISNPRLWDAKSDPYLYKVKVTISDIDGNPIDELEQPLGVRYYRVDRDSGLILNGKPYDLYGVCRHQEWEGKGPALSDEENEKDFELIKEIGANGIRFAHYQQADIMYRLCDENGLVAWAEIPNTPAYRGNIPGYLQNCKEQLAELIKQNYNHPSILFWGLYNEIDIPASYVRTLNETAKSLDQFRLTTQADFVQPTERHSVTDVVAWNWYFGWYYGNFTDYRTWYDKLHKEHPELKGGLSEYGAEACISQQEENPSRPDPQGRCFPEQYQNLYHEEVWRNIKNRRDIWCKFVWNMFDFSWTYATRGDKPYMNYKGLVTHDRQTKKDAFYFYKANWSDEPTLHIVSKRDADRKDPNVQVAVYTNLNEVELYVNGEFISKKPMDSDIHKIAWENIRLRQGQNQISVIGMTDEKKYADYCEWYYNKK
ncbi:MAG TPA: glycoside hydrolase family 2 TIM barrel-domain containing protein [Candidatus Acidoferrales bacterium]|nr:glycoside hydrolase family 2 TIM barrel-domain containing protein [Candidatus Acidoferrales bacterium]